MSQLTAESIQPHSVIAHSFGGKVALQMLHSMKSDECCTSSSAKSSTAVASSSSLSSLSSQEPPTSAATTLDLPARTFILDSFLGPIRAEQLKGSFSSHSAAAVMEAMVELEEEYYDADAPPHQPSKARFPTRSMVLSLLRKKYGFDKSLASWITTNLR